MKRDTKVTLQHLVTSSHSLYVGGNMEYIFHEEKKAIEPAKNSLVNNPR